MLARVSREDLAFVVHVGDLAGGNDCSDQLYQRRTASSTPRRILSSTRRATTNGSDCRRARRSRNPVSSASAKLREIFFADRTR
jgi:hypothetical protein